MKDLGKIYFYDITNTNNIIFSFNVSIDFGNVYLEYSDHSGILNLKWSLMDIITIQTSIKNKLEQTLSFNSEGSDKIPGFIKCDESQYVLSLLVDNDWRFIQIIDFNRNIFKELIETIKTSIINFRYVEINNVQGGHTNSPIVQNIKNDFVNNGKSQNFQKGGYSGKSSNAPDIISGTDIPKEKQHRISNPKKILNNDVVKKKDKIKKLLESDEAQKLINRKLD